MPTIRDTGNKRKELIRDRIIGLIMPIELNAADQSIKEIADIFK